MSYQGPRGNRIVYGGYRMRSNLETDLAVQLDSNQVQWRYEPAAYELVNGTKYWPDFQITADPLGIVGASYIEVKNHAEVYRLASDLGLPTSHIDGLAWTQPVLLSSVVTNTLGTFHKPLIFANQYRRSVLLYGMTTVNAAVVLINPDLTVQTCRRHPLHQSRHLNEVRPTLAQLQADAPRRLAANREQAQLDLAERAESLGRRAARAAWGKAVSAT